MEDVITAEHLRTIFDGCTAAPIVLDHIAFKKGMGTTTYPYTHPCTILNRVASQVADTCGSHNSTPPIPPLMVNPCTVTLCESSISTTTELPLERSVIEAPFLVISVSRSML